MRTQFYFENFRNHFRYFLNRWCSQRHTERNVPLTTFVDIAMQRPLHALFILICVAFVLIGSDPAPLIAQAQSQDEPDPLDIELTERWKTLLLLRNKRQKSQPIPADMPVRAVINMSFEGPHPTHPHLLGKYEADGRFIMHEGCLQQESGHSALIQLPTADSFDLEGLVNLKGEGSWLILLGWDVETNSGYCLYQPQLRVSGGPFHICRIEKGKTVTDSDREIANVDLNGEGALRIRVLEKELSMQVLDQLIVHDYTLKHYQPGAIMIGTYNSRYGPKKLGIASLRMRLAEKK